ncbi:hypothetical protein [Methanobrevibacter sp.]|uniref:hypothetical protein n=1 Tax=Methanobrevibacter sp. TaxID=66852 RepID=UPI0025DA7F26|nr:hypothetical protein [Methanobrevibacter sp.]MBQ6099713.1 hypothetical protein [Methanobrevibacter sp.]MBQ6513010.1 hypothetical protein [Methanobrevibacter sp.]
MSTSIKELKSVNLASFTIIMTAIAVLFSIISSIAIVIGIGIASPGSIGVSLYLIPTIIVGTFMYTIYNAFCEGFLFNIISKKVNTIKLAFADEKELIKVSTTQTAIIIAMIITIQVILIYLASSFILPLLLSSIMQTLMFSGQEMIAYSIYQILMLISQPMIIAMIIFGTFIISFVFVLLGTYIYNILANTGRGAVFNLTKEDNMTAIESIDTLKLGIVFAVVGGVLNLISALITLISGGEILSFLINVIVGFISLFIYGILIAIFYNFLAPKLGKIKLELIDQ